MLLQYLSGSHCALVDSKRVVFFFVRLFSQYPRYNVADGKDRNTTVITIIISAVRINVNIPPMRNSRKYRSCLWIFQYTSGTRGKLRVDTKIIIIVIAFGLSP